MFLDRNFGPVGGLDHKARAPVAVFDLLLNFVLVLLFDGRDDLGQLLA